MVQMIFSYGLPKAITGIMILYKNTKAMIRLSDGDANLSNIVAGVLQGDN